MNFVPLSSSPYPVPFRPLLIPFSPLSKFPSFSPPPPTHNPPRSSTDNVTGCSAEPGAGIVDNAAASRGAERCCRAATGAGWTVLGESDNFGGIGPFWGGVRCTVVEGEKSVFEGNWTVFGVVILGENVKIKNYIVRGGRPEGGVSESVISRSSQWSQKNKKDRLNIDIYRGLIEKLSFLELFYIRYIQHGSFCGVIFL